ncbi:MAG: tRNA lysidine(34) synthetase TilS [Thermoguttaceae bacterium]|nr:tRNA lysidine(34) synthetase TilS [Thermoguttaceae bacterium]
MSIESNRNLEPLELAVDLAIPSGVWTEHGCCLAVSGGADSISLLRAVARLAASREALNQIVVGHVDHGVRGEESRGDAAFVVQVAKALGLKCEVRQINAEQLSDEVRHTGSWEAAARNIRYALLLDIALKNGKRYIATAHTADDQIETVLQRLFRGTGISGLKAIQSVRPLNEAVVLLRPLLKVSRDEIESYLIRQGQAWRTDSSNASLDYTRNKIRRQLIPLLEEIFPNRWRTSVERLIHTAEEIDLHLSRQVDELEQTLPVRSVGLPISLELTLFENVPMLVLCEFFRKLWKEQNWPLGEMGREQWQRLADLVALKKGTEEFPGSIRARVEDDRLVFREWK